MVRLTGQPDDVPPKDASGPDDMAGDSHRQLIGYIGLLMPFFIIILAIGRDGEKAWRNLDSISAYYYTGAVTVFVGMLVALALFLFTYRGYANRYHKYDRAAAVIAASAALGLALFPTKVPEGFVALNWWAPWDGVIHNISAVVLLLMFAVFALWLFRVTPDSQSVRPGRKWRDQIYLICGVAILACIAWAGWEGMHDRSIFWPESIALVAFSISWLVKGYAHRTIAHGVQHLLRGRPAATTGNATRLTSSHLARPEREPDQEGGETRNPSRESPRCRGR